MPIRYRKPVAGDATAMWALARDSGALDLNSPYFYLTISHHFADTSIVAESDGEIAGFIAGLSLPTNRESLFVWQICVSQRYQRRGVAHGMLRALLDQVVDGGIRYLDATVTPSNAASQRMFRAFADSLGSACEESLQYPRALFPAGEHEEEHLLHIGPFTADAVRTLFREFAETKRGV